MPTQTEPAAAPPAAASSAGAAPPAAPRRSRFVRWYVGAAIILLNTVVAFILLNVLLLPVRYVVSKPAVQRLSAAREKFGADAVNKACAPMTFEKWLDVATVAYDSQLAFEQFAQAKMAPTRGKYVNVAPEGYRLVPNQGPWPIDPNNINVFAFGGSTMFGWGVSDEYTIPSVLQELLQKQTSKRVCVYNLGCGYYYSSNERIRFQQLLLTGHRPHLAIFMDGLNEFGHPEEKFENTDQLARAGEPQPIKNAFNHVGAIVSAMPVGQAARYVAHRMGMKTSQETDDPQVARRVIDRYLFNKHASEVVGEHVAVKTAFFYQPVPVYAYDLKYHLFGSTTVSPGVSTGYPLMAQYIQQHPMGDNFKWLAELSKGSTDPLYCDEWHYTPAFARRIAEEMAAFIAARKYLP